MIIKIISRSLVTFPGKNYYVRTRPSRSYLYMEEATLYKQPKVNKESVE